MKFEFNADVSNLKIEKFNIYTIYKNNKLKILYQTFISKNIQKLILSSSKI